MSTAVADPRATRLGQLWSRLAAQHVTLGAGCGCMTGGVSVSLEDFELDIVIGQGPGARSVKVPVEPFTLIGATTRAGLLTSPLRARFGIVHRLDFYAARDIEEIVRRSARILDVPMDEAAAKEIAARSRGTPRIVNRLLRRVRDYAQVRADGRITVEVARAAMSLLDVDQYGFDESDRRLVLTIIEKFNGGPVGLGSLAAALSEHSGARLDKPAPRKGSVISKTL